MDIPDNPLLNKATVADPALRSNSTNVVPFEKPRKRVSAKTERLIGELGLRYRPSVQADLEEHAATLALLTRDVADVPPDLLDRAIQIHVARSPYLPKASELIALAQSLLAKPAAGGSIERDGRENAERLAAKYNDHLRGEGRFNICWIVDEQNALKLEAV